LAQAESHRIGIPGQNRAALVVGWMARGKKRCGRPVCGELLIFDTNQQFATHSDCKAGVRGVA
jgi:hypothetical protein